MAADFHEYTLRYMAYMVQKILQQMYNGIYISQKELTRLKEIAQKAQNEGIPLVLVPTHKSHMYKFQLPKIYFQLVIISPSLMFFFSVVSPYLLLLQVIISSCQLSVHYSGITSILIQNHDSSCRQSGAFFIRRKFENDNLYKTVFHEYILTILEHGNNIEFFIGNISIFHEISPKFQRVVAVVLESS